ncbi:MULTISPECIES: hypothetical protein [unclassified Duganella]|uniref:hypothetical protein n=1 Tax=unclassified Duganella TaxID=2636909 RepID=UPI000B8365BA|nr:MULTISPECIES: hypothetical protein [unclassified Duganella]
MSTIAPPARYDLPWKAVVAHAFHPFMNFCFPVFSERIDWRQRPRFRDKELAGFGIPLWRPASFRQRMEGRTFTFTTAKLLDLADDAAALEASHLEAEAHNRLIQRD